MKLYYIITDSQKDLERDFFLPYFKSSNNKFEINEIYYHPKDHNLGNFWDKDYLDTLIFRNKKIIELIEKNIGNVIIISDVDIISVRDFYDIINNLILDKDILHMRDGIDGVDIINGGFTVIKCSEKTKKFYQRILFKTENSNNKKYLDQDAIKDYYFLENNFLNLKWDFLPASKFAVRYDWDFLEKNKNNLVMFHATNTVPHNGITSVELKKYYLTNFIKWFNGEIGRFYL